MILGDPLHNVESRLITVDTLGLDFTSGVTLIFPGVAERDVFAFVSPACCRRCRRTCIRQSCDRGAGSTPRLVNLSANEAKQRSAPSDTW